MHCGRVSNLLSAYIDRELAGAEMLPIRHHLDVCPGCAAEHESLRRVKSPEGGALIRRLEIPHGRFVREIALSGPALRIADSHYLNGCLEVHLVRSQGSSE